VNLTVEEPSASIAHARICGGSERAIVRSTRPITHRKLALIWQLIHNGSLFANNTLFWDEPEANLNPALMPEVAKILLMLAERGVQVFVATHDYAFLRELDFARQETPTRYFSLELTQEDGVIAHSFSRYRDIRPNKIADEFQRLYDLEVRHSLGDFS